VIRIGNRNYFNRDVMLDATHLISIGDDNMFGPGVYVIDSNHGMRLDGRISDAPIETASVQIGSDCWIGAKAIMRSSVPGRSSRRTSKPRRSLPESPLSG
jgi:maltose O-acetyltransferase